MLRRMHAEVIPLSLLYGITLAHCQFLEYHYINQVKSWNEAQQYCRDHYTDLATIENIQDVNRLPIPSDYWAWIGLRDDPASWWNMTADSNSWKWSATGTTSPGGYQYWGGAEPNNFAGPKWCVLVDHSGWMDMLCGYMHSFICYTAQSSGVKEYIFISDLKTWDDAQTFCRQNYHDLAMIETPSENQALMAIVTNLSTTAWIGLSRVPFKWSDGNPTTYRHWGPGQLSGDGYCVAQFNDMWNDLSCDSQLTFVCHRALKQVTRVHAKITLKTTADMNDPAIKGKFLKLLEDRLKEKDIVLYPSWVISPKTVEEKKNNPVCAPGEDQQ